MLTLSLKVMLGQFKNSITCDILTSQEPRAAFARDNLTRGDPGRIVVASRFPVSRNGIYLTSEINRCSWE